jgi:N-acetylmuramoyl-L-alanine amidase
MKQGAPVVSPWVDIGYHYGVEQFGQRFEIMAGRMLTEPGAHCRERGMNRSSIGICLVGNFDVGPPAPDQWDLSVRLVRSLMRAFGIPTVMVYGHREIKTSKTCPGHFFDLDRFRRELVK